MFHPMSGLSLKERADNNTRPLNGTGTPYLKAPGLLKVTAVRVGTQDLPLEMNARVPLDESLDKVAVTLPLVALDYDDEGCPILLRSVLSNDGIWQEGEKNIFVTGEWAEEDEDVCPAGAVTSLPRRGRQPSPVQRG